MGFTNGAIAISVASKLNLRRLLKEIKKKIRYRQKVKLVTAYDNGLC